MGILKNVTLDKDENHNKNQINSSNLKDYETELRDELKLFEVNHDLEELKDYRDGKKGAANKIDAADYEKGRKMLQDDKDRILDN